MSDDRIIQDKASLYMIAKNAIEILQDIYVYLPDRENFVKSKIQSYLRGYGVNFQKIEEARNEEIREWKIRRHFT